MSDKPVSYEMIERAFKTEPEKILVKLPDNTEAWSARRHLDLAYGYAKESLERAKPERGEG